MSENETENGTEAVDGISTVDKIEKHIEYNTPRGTGVDSRKERKAMRQEAERRKNTPTSELERGVRASIYAAKASRHLGEHIRDTDILPQMDE